MIWDKLDFEPFMIMFSFYFISFDKYELVDFFRK